MKATFGGIDAMQDHREQIQSVDLQMQGQHGYPGGRNLNKDMIHEMNEQSLGTAHLYRGDMHTQGTALLGPQEQVAMNSGTGHDNTMMPQQSQTPTRSVANAAATDNMMLVSHDATVTSAGSPGGKVAGA